MALLLADAGRLTQDQFTQGVVETIIVESQIIQMLPFVDVVGSALIYNQETTTGAATWYAVADTWSEAAIVDLII